MGKCRKTREDLGKAPASRRVGGTPTELMPTGLRLVGNATHGPGAEGVEASRAPPEHRASCVMSTSASCTSASGAGHCSCRSLPLSPPFRWREKSLRETLQTAEISPLQAPFSYLSERFSEAVCRLPHEMVILSTSNSSPRLSSNVSSLISAPLEK